MNGEMAAFLWVVFCLMLVGAVLWGVRASAKCQVRCENAGFVSSNVMVDNSCFCISGVFLEDNL